MSRASDFFRFFHFLLASVCEYDTVINIMKHACERCFAMVEENKLSQDGLYPECAEDFEAILEEDRRELNPEDYEDEDK